MSRIRMAEYRAVPSRTWGSRRTFLATMALIGSLMAALTLFPSLATAGYTDPTVESVSAYSSPQPPDGLKVTCLVPGTETTPSSTCPVLKWNGYTYWAYSYVNNDMAMAIVAYDEYGSVAGRWDRSGARYVQNITIDTTAGTVSFIGQGGSTITMTLDELYLAPLPPSITASDDVVVSNDWDQAGAIVNYPAPFTTGDVGTVTCSPASGSFFPIGTTTVTCTSSTTSASDTFTVTVNDTQAPTFATPSDIVVDATGLDGAVVTYDSPSASDNASGVVVVCDPASGSLFPIGSSTVTCTATDASGNTASSWFTVTVLGADEQFDDMRALFDESSLSGSRLEDAMKRLNAADAYTEQGLTSMACVQLRDLESRLRGYGQVFPGMSGLTADEIAATREMIAAIGNLIGCGGTTSTR